MIHESECTFVPDNASPGSIIRGDGDLKIQSTQLGLDDRIPYTRCILPAKIEVMFDSGRMRKFKLAGPLYNTGDMLSSNAKFMYWVYAHEGSCNINLHILHGK